MLRDHHHDHGSEHAIDQQPTLDDATAGLHRAAVNYAASNAYDRLARSADLNGAASEYYAALVTPRDVPARQLPPRRGLPPDRTDPTADARELADAIRDALTLVADRAANLYDALDAARDGT